MFILSSVIFIALFYGICVYGIMCDGGKRKIKYLVKACSVKTGVMIILISLLMAGFVAYWVKCNQYIYFWDLSGYWSLAIDRMNYMSDSSVVESVRSLLESINNDDYNVFLPSIIALPMKIVGNTFARYVFLVSVMFLIPISLVQGLLATKIVSNTEKNVSVYFVLGMILSFIMPANYYALFRGYVDVAFLLPMTIVIYLFVDYDFRNISISRNVSISLLLIVTWISRRYTIFFIIGFVVAMLVKAIFVLIEDKGLTNMKNIIVNFIIIGSISVGILIAFFRKFFFHALFTNYGKMYSAYDSPLSVKIQCLKASFGSFSIFIILIVGIMCIIHKRNRVNYISLCMTILATLCSFWMTQNMGTQHRMLLNVPVYTLFLMLFDFWKMEKPKNIIPKTLLASRGVIVLCLIVVLTNFGESFICKLPANGTSTFFSERYYPLRRNDLEEVQALVGRLNELTIGTDDWIYVAASGQTLNCDILMKADMPNTKTAVNNLLTTSDVDLRDGFPTDFLRAKYVVTTLPVELHLDSGQEVVSYLAEGVQNSESIIGCHYKEMEEYQLENGVVAKIYMKINEYSDDDLYQIRTYFGNLYPDSTDLFENRIYLN